LGLLEYYDDIVNHLADMAFPLTELFKEMCHGSEGEAPSAAFQKLKDLVTSPPCLLMPDLNLPFTIYCDASGFAIGVVLQQDQGRGLQPIAFVSWKLQPPERNLAPYDRELLALVHSLLTWKHLIDGAQLTVHTDHHALKYLMTAPTKTSRRRRWLTELMHFMFDIKYIKGSDNVVADALSRRAYLAALTVSSLSSTVLQEIKSACTKDPIAQRLVGRAPW
jgi:hypothetical protein